MDYFCAGCGEIRSEAFPQLHYCNGKNNIIVDEGKLKNVPEAEHLQAAESYPNLSELLAELDKINISKCDNIYCNAYRSDCTAGCAVYVTITECDIYLKYQELQKLKNVAKPEGDSRSDYPKLSEVPTDVAEMLIEINGAYL